MTRGLGRGPGQAVEHGAAGMWPPTFLVDARDPRLVEALARLEAATRRRDAAAVASVIDGVVSTPGGRWLLQQWTAAALRAMAGDLVALNQSTQHAETLLCEMAARPP